MTVLFIINAFQSFMFELSYDEAYYWVYSNFLSWGYYDHPPMVAWLIKLGSIWGHSEFGVRFFFNVLGVGSLGLLWKISNQKNPILFILLTLSLPLVQASGFLALPDTGLLFFSALFLYFVKDYLKNDSVRNIVGLSLTIPLLFYSKYHGLAVVLFTAAANVEFFRRKSFWVIVLSTFMLYMPHIYWQYQHDFISFKFHLLGRGEKVFELSNITNYLSGQIALFGTFNFILLLCLVKKIDLKDRWEKVLAFNVFGFLIVLLLVSFRNQIEANWTVSACMASVPLIMLLVEKKQSFKKYFYWGSGFSIILILILRVLLIIPNSFYENKDIGRLNEVKGWEKRILEIKKETKKTRLVSDTYQVAAKLSFYLKAMIPAVHLMSRHSHYSLLKEPLNSYERDEVIIFLAPKNLGSAIRVETGYKDPIYMYKTTLGELAERFKVDYKDIQRFELKF